MDTDSKFAFVIGINEYEDHPNIPKLQSAVPDARWVKRALEWHGYQVTLLEDAQATLLAMKKLLEEELPELLRKRGANGRSRFLFYFAGHGVAKDKEKVDGRPTGYLVPHGGRKGDYTTYLPMADVHDWLLSNPPDHLLVLLDCCNAGAFQFAQTGAREIVVSPTELTYERYKRYLRDPARQAITSSAYDETAADLDPTTAAGGVLGNRPVVSADQADKLCESILAAEAKWPTWEEDAGGHSPFATALMMGHESRIACDGPSALTVSAEWRPEGLGVDRKRKRLSCGGHKVVEKTFMHIQSSAIENPFRYSTAFGALNALL